MSKTSAEYLSEMEEKVARNKELAQKIFTDITEEEFNRQPKQGKWSPGQALEHINITNGKYLLIINNILKNPHAKKAEESKNYKHGIFMKKFIELAGPTTKLKMKVPNKNFVPQKELDKDKTINEYYELNGKLKAAVAEAKGFDIKRNKYTSPMASWLKLSLGDGFHLLANHDARHLQQAQRTLESLRRGW